MAGARIGPISGVNWAAYGNVASLIMQAAEASARGSAALGAGIGGGLQSLGQGIQRGRERREARAERQEARADSQARWEAEFGYRQQRDAADDARADRRLAMDSANIDEDNERIRTQGEIELLNRLIETSAKKATLADQAGNVPGLQAALAEIETLSAAQQGRLAKMLKINALPGTQPTAAQPDNMGPTDWQSLFTELPNRVSGNEFLRRPVSAGSLDVARRAFPGGSAPTPEGATERGGEMPAPAGAAKPMSETPSMARRRLEEAAVEREGMRLSGDQSGYRKALMPNGLPDDPMEVARTVVSQTANPAAKRAELMVAMLDTKIAALEQGKQSIGNKTPQDLIARRAHDRAQSILTNTKLPFLAVVDIGKQRGMALNEAAKKADEANKRAVAIEGEKSALDAAVAALEASTGRPATVQDVQSLRRQIAGGIKPDTAAGNFPKADKPKDDDRPVRLRKAVDSISGALAQAEKAAKEDNSLESISGGAPPAPKPPNLSGLVTDDVAEVVNAGPSASSPEVYAAAKAELERRGVKPGSVSAAAPSVGGGGAVERWERGPDGKPRRVK